MNPTELQALLKSGWHKTEIIDEGDGNKTIFRGRCSLPSATVNTDCWCINKTVIRVSGPTQTIDELFAEGNMQFDKVWTQRADYDYQYLI